MNNQDYHVLKTALMVYLSNKPQQDNRYLGDLASHHPELLAIFYKIIEMDNDPKVLSILDHTLFCKVGSTHQQS